MLDKPTKTDDVILRPVDKEAPAIFVRMNSQVGPNRTMEMSFGIPLDMTPSDLNRYIDKVAACAERQNDKGILEQAKLALKQAYQQVEANNSNLASYELKGEQEWSSRGKRGAWEPSGSQAAELKNFLRTGKRGVDDGTGGLE